MKFVRGGTRRISEEGEVSCGDTFRGKVIEFSQCWDEVGRARGTF